MSYVDRPRDDGAALNIDGSGARWLLDSDNGDSAKSHRHRAEQRLAKLIVYV